MARKMPTMAARIQSRLKWKKPTRYWMPLQEAATAMMPRKLVSSTSSRLTPSMASEKLMPHWGIQGHWSRMKNGSRPAEPPWARYCTQITISPTMCTSRVINEIQRGRSFPQRPANQASKPPARTRRPERRVS